MKRNAGYSGLIFFISLVLFLATPFRAAAQTAATEISHQYTGNIAPNTTWILHAIPVPGGYVLAKNGIFNNLTRITLPAGGSAIWIDNSSSGREIRYEPGNWLFDIITDKDWGKSGSGCQVDLGIWNGSTFIPFTGIKTFPSLFFMNYPAYDIRHVKYQSQAITLKPGENLAISISNTTAEPRNVITWENTSRFGAFFRYESSGPSPTGSGITTTSPVPTGGGGGGLIIPPPLPSEKEEEKSPTPTPTQGGRESPATTPPATTPGVTSLSGLINPNTGRFMFKVSIISNDGKARLDIPAGVIGRQANGAVLTLIGITRVNNPGETTSSGANFRAGNYFYKFEPAGARFDDTSSGRVLITLPYEPTPGYDPFIAFWDTTAIPPGWNAINPPFTLNTDNTVSGYIDHFTIYTVLGLKITPATTVASPDAPVSQPATSAFQSAAPAGTIAEIVPGTTTSNRNNPNESTSNSALMAGIIIASLAVAVVLVLIIRKRSTP